MAKDKAQGKKNVDVDADHLTEEGAKEFVEGLPEEQATALIPIVRNLPAPVVERLGNLLEEISSDQTGLEEMEAAWTPPIVKIRQPVTTDAPKNVEMGQLYTAEGDVFAGGFEFVPLYMHPAHLKFEEGESTPACRSEDGKMSIFGDVCKDCPDEPFKHGEPTDCSKFRNVFVFDKAFGRIYKLALGKTSYKAGTKLQRYWKGSGKFPWRKVYMLESKEVERKGGGVYYVYNIVPTGEELQDETLLQLGQFFYDRIKEERARLMERLAAQRQKAAEGGGKPVTEIVEDGAEAASKASEPEFGDGTM
jgi:hypothetical protein